MKHLRPLFVFAVVALALAGLWITDHMMGMHAPLRAQAAVSDQGGILADICGGDDEGDGGGCEDVIKSEDGYVPIPWRFDVIQRFNNEQGKATSKTVTRWGWIKVPVAQLGQCYYILVLVWFAFTGVPRRASRRWHLLPMVLSIFAVFATCYYIFVMAFRLEQWCPLCLLLHLADFLLCALIVALWPWAKEPKQTKSEKQKGRPTDAVPAPASLVNRHIYATLAVAAALISMSFLHRYDQLQAESAFVRAKRLDDNWLRTQKNVRLVLAALDGARPVDIPPRPTQLTVGDPNAKHELIMFTDLQCPACRGFEARLIKEILPVWKGRLKVTIRHYPLCTDCNKAIKSNKHPEACNSAYAVEAAHAVGGPTAALRMHDAIVEKYAEIKKPNFAPAGYERFAKDLGLDVGRFREAFQGPEVRRIVLQDIDLAKSLGITGTPTIFYNGRRLYSYPLQTNNMHFWKELARRQLPAATRQQEQTSGEGMNAPPGG